MTAKRATPLSPAVLHILLALSARERHGYDIMKQVAHDSRGEVSMGPGTLYGSLDRMMEAGLVARAGKPGADSRRIYYKLTAKGQTALEIEVRRLASVVKLAARALRHA